MKRSIIKYELQDHFATRRKSRRFARSRDLTEILNPLAALKRVRTESTSRRIQSEYATITEALLSEESSVGTFFGDRV
jgi:hypothetical protein